MNAKPFDLCLVSSDVVASRGEPDSSACVLSQHEDERDAIVAGRAYLRAHPNAWLQTQPSDQSRAGFDVVPE